MTKEEIIEKYQEAIDTAQEAVTNAQANLDAIQAERDEKIAQLEAYENALKLKEEAEAVIAGGLPKLN